MGLRINDVVKDHWWLRCRDTGPSRKLLGKVHIYVVFVECKDSHWSEAYKSTYKTGMREAIRRLTEEAASYGVKLELDYAMFDMAVPSTYTGDPMDYWKIYFCRNSIQELQDHYESKYGYRETPFMFIFNLEGRSYAYCDKNDDGWITNEMSVIYRPFSAHAIMHELLHQFGARDYYFPEWVAEIARHYFPDSVMLSSSGMKVDDLTAYLVGWQDTISVQSYWLLQRTLGLTWEAYLEAHAADEVKNGKGGPKSK